MEKVLGKTQILDGQAVQRKIKRMALEIAEQNLNEGRLVLAGIAGNGTVVADLLAKELTAVTGTEPQRLTVELNKAAPTDVSFHPKTDFGNAILIIADDVANTGRSIFYALKPFFEYNLKKIQTAVLVERSHKLFPIQTDYTGLSVSTTLQEHIEVTADEGKITGAWLY